MRLEHTISIRIVSALLILTTLPFFKPFSAKSNTSAEEKIEPSLLKNLHQNWMINFGQGLLAQPAFDNLHAFVPLRDGTLKAVRLIDGTLLWSVIQPTHLSPTIGQNTVFIANNEYLVARRTSDAHLLWTSNLGSPISSPLLLNKEQLIATLDSGEVVALRSSDGYELWRSKLNGQLHTKPSIHKTELFISTSDGRVVALQLQSGTKLWERLLGGKPKEILALDTIFVGSTDNYMYSLSRKNGNINWRWRTGGDIVGAPTADSDRVYFLSLDNNLRALARNGGTQRWRRPLDLRPSSTPILRENILLVSGLSPVIGTFDKTTGKPVSTFQASTELAAPPHLFTDQARHYPRIILTTADGKMTCLQHVLLAIKDYRSQLNPRPSLGLLKTQRVN